MSELLAILEEHFAQFSSGFFITLRLVAIAFVIAMIVGTLVAALRIAPARWMNLAGEIYVETFRNIPLLVLLFMAFAGLRRAGVPITPWVAGSGSLGLYTAAYVGEALRSGAFAVGRDQIDAGLSLGLSYRMTMRRIVLPQAFRNVIPAIGSLVIAMIKNSAIIGVSLLALPDLLQEARVVQGETFQTVEVFFWAAAGYLLLTGAVTMAFRWLESRYAIRR